MTLSPLKRLLQYQVLGKIYSRRQFITPMNFTDTFWKGNPEQVDGDNFQFMVEGISTQPVAGNTPNASAKSIGLNGLSSKRAWLLNTFNVLPLLGDALLALRNPETQDLQDKGKQEVKRQMDNFKYRHAMFKEVALSQVLTSGVIYFDRDFNILPSSSGAKFTCDFGVPATRKTNLNGLITASLKLAGTDIQLLVDSIDQACDNANVPRPTDYFVNSVNKQYFYKNSAFIQWAQYNNQDASQVLRGNLIEGMFGKNWHFWGGVWTDVNGGSNPFIPTNKLIAVPPIVDGGWWRTAEGSSLVPTTTDLLLNEDALLASLQKVYGQYAYAKASHDPIGMNMYMGEKFGMAFADELAVWMGDAFT